MRIDRMLDPSPRRKEVTDSYCTNDGRPGIHPEMAVLRVSAGLVDDLAYLGDEASAAAMLRVDRPLRAAVNAELARLQARAVDIVRTHRAALEAGAAAPADRRHLSGDQVREIFEIKAARSTIEWRPQRN